jgi:hypothetical protein
MGDENSCCDTTVIATPLTNTGQSRVKMHMLIVSRAMYICTRVTSVWVDIKGDHDGGRESEKREKM